MAKRDFIRRLITKAEYEKLLPWPCPVSDADFAHIREVHFEDDWVRPLHEDEMWLRFVRVSGDCLCSFCGFIYYDHPQETRIKCFDGGTVGLVQLCNGWLGHT